MRYPKIGDKVKINDNCVSCQSFLIGKSGIIQSIYGIDDYYQNICLILDDPKYNQRVFCGFTMEMLDYLD